MVDISNDMYIIRTAICEEAAITRASLTAPHVLLKPDIYPDGNQWCCLLGADLMVGIAGFGDTPEKAAEDFDRAWRSAKPPVVRKAS